jgi:hypothetical protein
MQTLRTTQSLGQKRIAVTTRLMAELLRRAAHEDEVSVSGSAYWAARLMQRRQWVRVIERHDGRPARARITDYGLDALEALARES